ncbi:DUF5808 domain-containing protein [Paenibacillus sp. NPDC058071]
MIYINKNDPSLIVEKKYGLGWTINMGNKWTAVVILLLLVPPLLFLFL